MRGAQLKWRAHGDDRCSTDVSARTRAWITGCGLLHLLWGAACRRGCVRTASGCDGNAGCDGAASGYRSSFGSDRNSGLCAARGPADSDVDSAGSGCCAPGVGSAFRTVCWMDAGFTNADSAGWAALWVDTAAASEGSREASGAAAAVQCLRRWGSAEPDRGYLYAMRMAAPAVSRLPARCFGIFVGAGRPGNVEVAEHFCAAHSGKDCVG